jgi:hypothetical protein
MGLVWRVGGVACSGELDARGLLIVPAVLIPRYCMLRYAGRDRGTNNSLR